MMQNLVISDGDSLLVESVSLPVATFAMFEPQSTEFLDITDPKAMLENTLRSFACLTVGDMVGIHYNDRLYELRILQTRPQDAVSIIECDMDVRNNIIIQPS
jgi:ubiquitin fusion degradation protein 1